MTAALLTSGACSSVAPDASQTEDESVEIRTGQSTDGTVFDSAEVHTISVQFDQADYDAMIEVFAETGEKEWISATVAIDGTSYDDVGLRLKGNSSLAGLGGAGRGMGDASSQTPESLPWLISLDKYVDGQNDRGVVDLVVRSNVTETSLNEAVALELVEEAGLTSQRSASARFSVNGSEEALRLVVENPKDEWADANLGGEGVLYKAESGGDYSYRGDDPEAYTDVFDQETDTDEPNYEPLFAFLDFINNSDDATFSAELGTHLDVESFATYLAIEELVGNFDDIDGPGNNSYLWYDESTEQMTVLAWDHNLAFGASGAGGRGGPPQGDAGARPEGMELPEGFEPPEGMELPEGFEPPEGMELPEGFEPSEGMELPEGFEPSEGMELPEGFEPADAGGGRGFGPGGTNILVERFMANADFAALYEEALAELQASLYDSGLAAAVLEQRAGVLRDEAGDLVEPATVDSEVQAVLAVIEG